VCKKYKLQGGFILAIIDMLEEMHTYGRNWCEERGFHYIGARYITPDNDVGPPFVVKDIIPSMDSNLVNNPSEIAHMSQQHAINRGSQPMKSTFTFEESIENTTTTSTTHGVSANVSITSTTSFKIRFVEQSIEVNIGAEYNYSKTEEITESKSQGWSESIEVIIPPQTKVTTTYFVMKGPYNLPIDLKCTMIGDFEMEYSRIPNGSRATEVIPVGKIVIANNTPGFKRPEHAYAPAYYKGVTALKGDVGIESFVEVVEEPLSGNGEIKTYKIPLTKSSLK